MRRRLLFTFIITTCLSFLIVLFNFFIISADDRVNKVNEDTKPENRLSELLEHGKSEYYQGNLNEAEKIYEYIINNDNDNLLAYKNLYFINKEQGNIHTATEYLEKVHTLDPENDYWRYKLGINLYSQNDTANAFLILAELYNEYKGIINDKDNNKQLNNIIENNNNQNEIIENRTADFHSNTLTEKEYSILCYYLGHISFNSGNIAKARSFYQEGIDTASHIVLNYIGLADLYNSIEKHDEALDFYLEALKRDSSILSLYPTIAELYEKNNNAARAFYYWRRSLASGINRTHAQKRISQISEEHPEFLKVEEEEKNLAREDIKWANISDYTFDKSNVPDIKVGIVENVNKVSFRAGESFEIKINDEVLFKGEEKKSYSIEYHDSNYKIYQQDNLIKTLKSSESMTLNITNNSSTFLLFDISYGQGYFWAGTEDRQYRGKLEMYPVSNEAFHIINIINLEYYLFSVVPAEMPAWWPDEAIKAQTIAARSYALSHLGKHSSDGYDLCDTVHCAAYNGVKSETKKTNELILETIGEVAVYENRPITAVFSSNSGGYSENSADIWGNNYEYLSGANNMKNDNYSFPLEPHNLERWLIEEPESYSNVTSYSGYNIYRWIKVLDADYFEEKYNLESLVDIIPFGRTKGGTINNILIKGISEGEERNIVIKDDIIRSSLGGLKSNRFTIEKLYNDKNMIDEIIFYGSGWGHNVGMDQTGAAGMASANYNYKEIIKHFYQNTSIQKEY